MANYSCPCCGTNLRKWRATTGLVPWWKPLPAESAYKARLFRCRACSTLLEKKPWAKGMAIRAAVFFVTVGIGGLAFYHRFDLLPYSLWVSIGMGLGVLVEMIEDMVSARPAYVESDLAEAALSSSAGF